MSNPAVLTPPALKPGDRIAVVSPSSIINPEIVRAVIPILESEGWTPYIGNHALNRYGNFAGTDSERFADLEEAFLDPSVRAVFCGRGGFGAVHLMTELNNLPLRKDPKWIIGFSDISALHALMSTHGIESIHSPMARHLVRTGGKDTDSQHLFSILRGVRPHYDFAPDNRNRYGVATGQLLGGNLAVISSLLSTPYNVIRPGCILFIEDIAEQIYKVDRILHTLILNNTLPHLSGLIVGQFTEYNPGYDGKLMEDMIYDLVKEYDYPVLFNAPIGHVDHNIPLIYSSEARLEVNPSGAHLYYL